MNIQTDVRKGNYMHLYSGRKYYPLDPRPEEVFIRDIAHSLAMKCRYAGHTKFFYSVAQHSVYTALANIPGFNDARSRLERLLHDGSEAYNGDLIRPLKYDEAFSAPFKHVEEINERAISERFDLPYPHGAHVKIADEAVTEAECRQLIALDPNVTFDKPLHCSKNVADIEIQYMHPTTAKSVFMSVYGELSEMVKTGQEFDMSDTIDILKNNNG